MKALTYFEMDLDRCALTYGVGACDAALGVTGTKKCFNSIATCQDRANFDTTVQTLRFGKQSGHYPKDIEHIPLLKDIQFTGATISLGENLGQRATLTVSFIDGPHSDTGLDKYIGDRGYNPFKQGTFWGKFRARQRYLQGRLCRVIRGYVGQSLSEMRTRHYVIESFTGPNLDGTYTIVAKDVLKLADGDRAQAPLLSNGFLAGAMTTSTTSVTLQPTGIGNLEYPASGRVAISGTEVCSFTRSGDTLTLTRAQLGTVAATHAAGDRVQLVLSYVSMDPADIIADLIENYTEIDPDFIPLAAWQLETGTFLQRLYTAHIAEPTSVNKLISELVQQACLALWWDDLDQQIGLQVLRGVSTDADRFDESNYVENSLSYQEQPEKRISQAWTYYGLRNPLRPVTDPDNYVSSALTPDLEAEDNYGSAAIKKIFARWIPSGGRSVALRVNDIQLGRYTDPPRKFTLALFRDTVDAQLAGGYKLSNRMFQNDEGEAEDVPIQVTSLNESDEGLVIEGQEVLFKNFDPTDLSDRTIVIEVSTQNVNLRTLHDAIFPVPTDADVGYVTVTCVISSGVTIGSSSTSLYAFEVGSWPAGLDIIVKNFGRIAGRGGKGGNGGHNQSTSQTAPTNGDAGGHAFRTTVAIDLDNAGGVIAGGAGGGGGGDFGSATTGGFNQPAAGGGGGGGAGSPAGSAGARGRDAKGDSAQAGDAGTLTAGGDGGNRTNYSGQAANNAGDGGDGGDPGQAGATGGSGGAAGGAAGRSIQGHSLVTYINVGTLLGPTNG